MAELLETVKREKIIAIVRGYAAADVLKIAEALYRGGIRLMEITFNQGSSDCIRDTAEAIRAAAQLHKDMYVGAGTVLTEEQVRAACQAGAKYIITPNVDERVIRLSKELGMLALPGALSPTEVVKAYQCGADMVKLFPVEGLGTSYIRALRGPLNHIPMLAVGGVDLKNMKDFYEAGVCGFGIGGNIINKKLIQAGDFEGLERLARKYVDVAKSLIIEGGQND